VAPAARAAENSLNSGAILVSGMGELLGSVPFLRRRALPLVVFLALIWAGLGEVRPAKAFDATLVAAGDIAGCGHVGDTLTAALVGATGGTVATLGDSVYNNGSAAQFTNCYGPTWGRFKWRTRPAAGNHEYRTPGANGYFNYFGDRAGPRGKGWYSYNIGTWHVVVLNSNCSKVACGKGSEQERWLRADLAAHPQQCTLAYWHHPRFSSDNRHGNWAAVGPFWDALYEHGAELVLSGHAHTYERFAPQTPWAKADPATGIRQFVVGTGGAGRYGFRGVKANSQVRNASTFGVLNLDLRPGGYDWRFVSQAGKTFGDSGSASCHGRPAAVNPPPTTTSTRPVVTSSSTTTTTRPKVSSSTTTTTTRPGATSSSTTTTTRPKATTSTTKPPATTTTTRRAGYYG
jgi:hypothetical protein